MDDYAPHRYVYYHLADNKSNAARIPDSWPDLNIGDRIRAADNKIYVITDKNTLTGIWTEYPLAKDYVRKHVSMPDFVASYEQAIGEYKTHADAIRETNKAEAREIAKKAVHAWAQLYPEGLRPTLPTLKFATKELVMSSIKIETKTFINGVDANSLTTNQLFDMISAAEAEIERLGKLQHVPKKVKSKIAELETGILALVELSDAQP